MVGSANLANRTGKSQLRQASQFSTKYFLHFGVLYLFAFAFAEYVTYYVDSLGGVAGHLIILFILIIFIAFSKNEVHRRFWLAMGLAPIIAVMSVALPVILEISQILWYIIISIPILMGILVFTRVLKYSLDDIGINGNHPVIQSMVAIGGLLLGAIGYYLLKPHAWTNELAIQTTLFPAVVLVVFTGLVEEMVFRGVMQRAATAIGSFEWIYIAVVYAIMQLGQLSILYCVFAFFVSVIFGWIVKRTGSILGVSLAHGLINVGFYLVFPFIL